jgi:hypothetical protein
MDIEHRAGLRPTFGKRAPAQMHAIRNVPVRSALYVCRGRWRVQARLFVRILRLRRRAFEGRRQRRKLAAPLFGMPALIPTRRLLRHAPGYVPAFGISPQATYVGISEVDL